ncbi:MAG: response regulator [Lachnospiraceae bacterium]|nr:response regulator [Lachnospiraceae bacterium]
MKNFRKENEELNALIDSLLENSKDYVFVKDENSVYVAASDSFAKLFGYEHGEEIVGLDAVELTRNENIGNALREGDYKVLTTGEPIRDSLEEGRITGRSMRCTLSTSKYPIYDKNKNIIGILGIARDITSEKKSKKMMEDYRESYESAIKTNVAKSAFLSGMCHDIRTPMNSILGLVSLSECNLDDKEKLLHNFDKIKEAGKYISSIINEVLDIEKIEEGKAELNVCDFDLNAFLENFAALTQDSVKSKGIHFDLYNNLKTVSHIIGDPTRIEQILTNLVSNSIKFTPLDGEVSVTVNEKENVNGIARLEIIIKDNGGGIEDEIMEHIFEPFAVKKVLKRAVDNGVGLGLVITRNLVKMMGGDIFVDSKPGEGTKVTLRMNFVISDGSDKEDDKAAEEDFKEDFKGKRALLVEDNDLNAEIATEVIEMTRMEVERAFDGRGAVDMFAASDKDYYDVIFMDIQMPIMGGYEATRLIRKMRRKEAKTIPIIALTANAFVSDINEAKDAGMNEHLAKPVDFEKLCITLSKFL